MKYYYIFQITNIDYRLIFNFKYDTIQTKVFEEGIMSNVKSINGLMKYLREKHNIQIEGSNDKIKLKNIGYYHRL